MRKMFLIGAAIVGAAIFSASPISVNWSGGPTLSQDRASATVGKPLSAGSVAGVHRRHERRENRHATPK